MTHQYLKSIGVKGIPHRTPRNELSVLATEIPQLLSSCTRPLPKTLLDKETRIRNRHVDFLLNPQLADTIRLRSEITKFLRQWLLDEEHIEVQTPILADAAGGAVARPFHTSATEFQDRQIALRIAPELWLKRLIVGGFERVFEIGPSFRNEGTYIGPTNFPTILMIPQVSISATTLSSLPVNSTGATQI